MRLGSLCTGIGGADLALEALGFGRPAWCAEVDRAAKRVLAARYPEAPNLGDLRAIDWERLEPVDALVAGYPCQTESFAGRRRGEADERWVWPQIAAGLRVLEPRLVFFENVLGHLSLGLPTVVADLDAAGYDVWWQVTTAASVGAPHLRKRVFVVGRRRGLGRTCAPPPAADPLALRHGGGFTLAQLTILGPERLSTMPAAGRVVDGALYDTSGSPCLGAPEDGSCVPLLPTPAASQYETDQERWEERRAELRKRGVNGNGFGLTTAQAIQRLLPTPAATDAKGARNATATRRPDSAGHLGQTLTDALWLELGAPSGHDALLPTPMARDGRSSEIGAREGSPSLSAVAPGLCLDWGPYAAAVARWERGIGRPAPGPLDHQRRLAPAFVEWMMGLPAGWVTDLGLARTPALRVLGNAVVPQQGAAAWGALLRAGVTAEDPAEPEVAAGCG